MGIKYDSSMYAAIGISIVAAGAVTLMLTPVLGPLSVAAAGLSTIPVVSQIAVYSVSAIAYGGSALGMFFGWTVIALPVVKGAEVLYDNLISPAMVGMSNLASNVASWFKSSNEAEKKRLQDESKKLADEKAKLQNENKVHDARLNQLDEAERRFQKAPDLSGPAGHADDKVNQRAEAARGNLEQVRMLAGGADVTFDDIDALLSSSSSSGHGRDK